MVAPRRATGGEVVCIARTKGLRWGGIMEVWRQVRSRAPLQRGGKGLCTSRRSERERRTTAPHKPLWLARQGHPRAGMGTVARLHHARGGRAWKHKAPALPRWWAHDTCASMCGPRDRPSASLLLSTVSGTGGLMGHTSGPPPPTLAGGRANPTPSGERKRKGRAALIPLIAKRRTAHSQLPNIGK
jgi:hypothetical protein